MIRKNDLRLIRGVLFDAVGTLIDPAPSAAEAYSRAAERQGIALDAHVVRARFQQTCAQEDQIDSSRGLVTSEIRERERWKAIVAACLAEVPDPGQAFRELWDHFAQPQSWTHLPAAASTLARLDRAGYRIAIASNFDSRLRSVLLGHPELSAWADGTVISSEVGVRKPHPEFYRVACRKLDLPPHQVLHVGDDRENDLDGPRNAGLSALLLADSTGPLDDSAEFISLGSLARLLTGPPLEPTQ
jgi:putative hydrolase of the HAD superfamily